MGLRDELMSLARELEQEDNAAFDLWTWLPSYQAAKRHHGDYALEVRPYTSEIMKEAALVFAAQRDPGGESAKELEAYTTCPCGEES